MAARVEPTARLGPPLCFNFLKLLHETDPRGLFVGKGKTHATAVSTYFTLTSFGHMDQIPFFSGDYFNNYAPLLIVVIAGCTLLNLGSGLLQCCAKCCPCVAAPTFSFDDDFSDARIDHGAQILLHEKHALAEGVPLGACRGLGRCNNTAMPPRPKTEVGLAFEPLPASLTLTADQPGQIFLAAVHTSLEPGLGAPGAAGEALPLQHAGVWRGRCTTDNSSSRTAVSPWPPTSRLPK